MTPKFILSTEIQEEDYPRLFIIQHNSFSNYSELAGFFPDALDPTQLEANIQSFKIGVFGGSNRVSAKITDAETDEITSFVTCRIYPGTRGVLDTPPIPDLSLPRVLNAADREYYEWYWNTLRARVREIEIFHQPHLYVQTLCTDPGWQRQGMGRMLMNWCIEYCKKEGLGRCALLASPFSAEVGFYEGFGFRREGFVEFVDEERWPGRAGTRVVVMVRDI